ncbi:hypothetical protein PVA45_01995 [Entomospira entomophila]|uniref:Uncharacterized protein n=1 Tax=Entomospira entomophila TaxID=2719988 RepID=A0A968G9H3_9SPIO|nr:hypothetical protein [Entomospira entomophilus]NIZ40285.1 hypothetical protein [Entomospira entomophilus]WDI35844.1 hypothetical protein PVA45_01995 [Entomospira entomophilus]
MRILMILMMIGLLSWVGMAQESIQRINGFDWQRGASHVITQLEEQFGAGKWITDGKEYQLDSARFIGHHATIHLYVEGDFIRRVVFSWKDTGDTLAIRSYWRTLLQELLGVMVEVNLFSGEYTWHVGSGNMVRWRSLITEEKRMEEAQSVKGRLTSKGSSRRLYSIDGEEYETEETIEIEELQIGEEQTTLVQAIEHQVEFYFLPPLPSSVTQEGHDEHQDSLEGEDGVNEDD